MSEGRGAAPDPVGAGGPGPASLRGERVVLFGAAGLVGQNLVPLLKARGVSDLVCIDKHAANTAILRRLHPDVEVIEADMAEPGPWQAACAGATGGVMLQAQIGGERGEAFQRNNVDATRHALAALAQGGVPYLVHLGTSATKSAARDWYTESKREQERLVAASAIAHALLRPTLMFGPFDRKHLGWLSRFMMRTPVFPIPGHGRYLRQPLYVRDLCAIVTACLERRIVGDFDITGRERIDYVDLIRTVRREAGGRARIVHLPLWLFWSLLKAYGLLRPDAPFTTKQLRALLTPDEFDLIPWWDLFGVASTPFRQAAAETFGPHRLADVVLEF